MPRCGGACRTAPTPAPDAGSSEPHRSSVTARSQQRPPQQVVHGWPQPQPRTPPQAAPQAQPPCPAGAPLASPSHRLGHPRHTTTTTAWPPHHPHAPTPTHQSGTTPHLGCHLGGLGHLLSRWALAPTVEITKHEAGSPHVHDHVASGDRGDVPAGGRHNQIVTGGWGCVDTWVFSRPKGARLPGPPGRVLGSRSAQGSAHSQGGPVGGGGGWSACTPVRAPLTGYRR